MPTPAFSAPRARLVRAFNGWSRAQLAEKLSVTPQYVGYVETGSRVPSDPYVLSLADAAGFLPEFFFAEPLTEFRDDECHFRKRSSAGVFLRAQALARGTLLGQLVQFLDNKLRLPQTRLPIVPIAGSADIERAAEQCRMAFGVGLDRPIDNMIRTLEHAGIVVSHFEGTSERVDAFSRSGSRNIIVLNTLKECATRTRFDAAHELGHLVMHVGLEPGLQERENEANRFASAFLLPRTGFAREFPRGSRIDWSHLFALKARWKVSVQAIVRRAFDLQLVSPVQYQSACKYIGFRGWRKAEPGDCAPEPLSLISTSLSVLEENGVSFDNVSESLRWSRRTLQSVSGVSAPEKAPTPSSISGGKVLAFDPARRARAN